MTRNRCWEKSWARAACVPSTPVRWPAPASWKRSASCRSHSPPPKTGGCSAPTSRAAAESLCGRWCSLRACEGAGFGVQPAGAQSDAALARGGDELRLQVPAVEAGHEAAEKSVVDAADQDRCRGREGVERAVAQPELGGAVPAGLEAVA